MKFGGIDIGSLTGKAVVLEDDDVVGSAIIPVRRNPVLTSTLVYNEVLDGLGIEASDVAYCVGTGYGRERIPFVQKSLSEISCHGKGAHFLDPEVRTIVDVGGQDCKVICLDDDGDLLDFVMNEKCAAGTGRYLEIMADLLDLSLDQLGSVSLKAKTPVAMNSTCSIYAQAEVLQYIARKTRKEDIAAGISRAMAERVAGLVRKLAVAPEFTITGGVAKNAGVVRALEDILGVEFRPLSFDPQLVGALGAARFARESSPGESTRR
ncbi:MAG: acyl-CoA dehydratase activase [Promethearchaeota archaeon]